jgi:gluconokinase
MPHVPGLRSPYIKVGRLVYFGRMLDKIRLNAQGKLPVDYLPNLGDSKPSMFDTRCCSFTRVPFSEISRRALEPGTDEEVLEWVEAKGGRRPDEECLVWNSFLMKRGWHDPSANVEFLKEQVEKAGLGDRKIETYFDYIDFDEGRDPFSSKAWESVY